MTKIAKEYPQYKEFTIVETGFGASAAFYCEQYNREKEDFNVSLKRRFDFKDNQIILICRNSVFNSTKKLYNFQIIKEWESCKLLKIVSKK